MQKRLGLENARTLVVPGHFDYQKQALLYVPQHLPEPRNPAFAKMAAEEIVADPGAQPRPRVRAVHQLSADAAWCTTGCRCEIEYPDADAGHGPAQRAAGGVPRDAELRAVRDVVVLAGRGRAGRAVELRYHR